MSPFVKGVLVGVAVTWAWHHFTGLGTGKAAKA